MPTDYYIERNDDGSVIVWLSEHDPIERMKGMVGIVLKPGEAKFETRMETLVTVHRLQVHFFGGRIRLFR